MTYAERSVCERRIGPVLVRVTVEVESQDAEKTVGVSGAMRSAVEDLLTMAARVSDAKKG